MKIKYTRLEFYLIRQKLYIFLSIAKSYYLKNIRQALIAAAAWYQRPCELYPSHGCRNEDPVGTNAKFNDAEQI